jgi:hypothetical protein
VVLRTPKELHRRRFHAPKAIPMQVFFVFFTGNDVPQDFKTEVISKFSNDDASRLCQIDQLITLVGSRLSTRTKARQDKKVDVRRSVMADMRRLAGLFVQFKVEWQKAKGASGNHANGVAPNVTNMFHCKHYDFLEKNVYC